MKTKLIVLFLLLTAGAFAGPRIVVGAGYPYYRYAGPRRYYAAPPPVAYVAPRYGWRAGYWARPPYPVVRPIAPRYYGGRYYRGYRR